MIEILGIMTFISLLGTPLMLWFFSMEGESVRTGFLLAIVFAWPVVLPLFLAFSLYFGDQPPDWWKELIQK